MQSQPPQSSFTITKGECSALFAYDLGFSIDLNRAQRLLNRPSMPGTQRETLRHSRRAPKYFEYQPPPLRVALPSAPLTFGRFASAASVDAVVFDFGGVSISYTIPIDGPVEDLLGLSNSLFENVALLADSHKIVDELIRLIEPAVAKPFVASLVEDYIVFDIDQWSPADGHPASIEGFVDSNRQLLARILRSDSEALSTQEVDDALTHRIAYGLHDCALIDWNAALLIGREMHDVLAVVEFANLELLEMRFLDDQLDEALGGALEATQRPTARRYFSYRSGADLRRIARLQVDSALLYEGVNNALKLLGDQYLARVYRLAAARLHLPEWDGSILRKLATLESIYEKLSDRDATRRMEVLEWIIILLIALSMLPLIL